MINESASLHMAVSKKVVVSFIFPLLFLVYTCCVSASDRRLNTLEEQLSGLQSSDVSRLPLLIELAEQYLYQDPAQAEQYALQALPLISEGQDESTRARVLRLLGMASIYLGKNSPALSYLTQAIAAARITKDVHLLSVCYRSAGVYYELLADYDNAVKFYIEAIKYGRLSDNITDLAMVYNNLGNVLNSQGDYVEAADYFEQAANIHKSTQNHEMAMNASVGLATSYLKQQRYDKALQLFKSILADENSIYDFTYSEASVNLAHVYQALEMNDKAIAMYTHVIEDPRAGSYPQALAAAYLGLAKLYATLGQFDSALSLYKRGIVKVKNKTSVESEIELYENLALLELKLGFYEDAANTQAEYIARRNAIQPVTQAGMIKELEDQLKSERELTSLQEALLKREREAKHSSLFLLTSVVISLFCLVLFLALRLRHQKMLRLEQANASLLIASETDPLTRIGNRRFLDRKLSRMRVNASQIAFLLLDVDHFKELNDTYGHAMGDDVLVLLADKLNRLCRKDDAIARIGGEEFVILLSVVDQEEALLFAERVREYVASNVAEAGARITVSIGVAVGDTDKASYDELYKQADMALYRAKTAGRNCVRVYA